MFTKATEKAKKVSDSTGTKNKKSTTWIVGDPEGDEIGKAVHEIVGIRTKIKALEGQLALYETPVKDHAVRKFIQHIAEVGVLPETPNYVQNAMGEKVTFISQDRSTQYAVKPEQKEALIALLGEDVVADLTFEETKFKFNADALAKPGVAEAVEKALGTVDRKLRKEGKLTDEDTLVDADVKEAFKPGTLGRVGIVCGKDATLIRSFLDAMGASWTKFLKA
jgi:hypothetical protein